jgi:ABC-type transporter Mla maintaining outer membrane lipid asymmetry ATPase subunit MlaF
VLVTGTPEELRRSEDPTVRRFLDRQPAEGEEEAHRFRRWMTEESPNARS